MKENMDIYILYTILLLRWMTMLIQQLMENLGREAVVPAPKTQEKLWRIGRINYKKYQCKNVQESQNLCNR